MNEVAMLQKLGNKQATGKKVAVQPLSAQCLRDGVGTLNRLT